MKNIDGNATWDENATFKVAASFAALSTDVRAEEACYVALADPGSDQPRGFVKIYPDGTAAYWTTEGEQGKPATSHADAQQKLFTVWGSGRAILPSFTAKATGTVT